MKNLIIKNAFFSDLVADLEVDHANQDHAQEVEAVEAEVVQEVDKVLQFHENLFQPVHRKHVQKFIFFLLL